MIYILTLLVFISAIFCIRAKYNKSQNQFLIFKPLTLLLIILIAISFPAVDVKYKIFIVSGLLFSLVGDILLVFPESYFKKGLIAFLIGHLCYIIAFIISDGIHFTYWIFFPIALAGVIYLRYILPNSGTMKFPVGIYIIVIAIMGWLAIERFNSLPSFGTFLAGLGAIIFMISDAVLALNKFRKSFFSAEFIILITYYVAQWLLALSVISN